MRATILCLFMLALVAHADKFNWAGNWYSAVGSNSLCAPAGIVTVTQDNDNNKGTIKGKWDPFSATCKALELADQALDNSEGVLTDTTLTFTLKSKNDTQLTIEFIRASDASTIKVENKLPTPVSASTEVTQKSDDELAKIKNFAGTYTFKLTEGEAAKCCLPESLEVGAQGKDLAYTSGKWANSDGCKDQKLGDVAWEKYGASYAAKDGASGIKWEITPPFTYGVIQMADEKKASELTFMNTMLGSCKVSATRTAPKEDSKWWIWVLVAVGVLIVAGVVGYVVYTKRKSANAQRTPLMNA